LIESWKIHKETGIGFWEYPLRMWLEKVRKYDETVEQPRVGYRGCCLTNLLMANARVGKYGYEEGSFAWTWMFWAFRRIEYWMEGKCSAKLKDAEQSIWEKGTPWMRVCG